jgi:hypothetical protein
MIPSYGQSLASNAELCMKVRAQTSEVLGLKFAYHLSLQEKEAESLV